MLFVRASIFLILFSFPALAIGAEFEHTVLPVSVVVSTSTNADEDEVHEWIRGGLIYDDTFKNPDEVTGKINVACYLATKIGVTFVVQKADKRRRGTPEEIRFQWVHSDPAIRYSQDDHSHSLFFPAGKSAVVDWELLPLTQELKQDGRWTLRAWYGDKQVTEQVFNLINCQGAP